jgi:signal transduction histidine kinase
MTHTTPEDQVQAAELRGVDLFDGLDDAEVAQWARLAGGRDVAAGEIVVDQGRPAPGLILLTRGTLETSRVDADGAEGVDHYDAPSWMAAVALLTDTVMPLRVRTETSCRLAIIAPADFRRLIRAHESVFNRVMARVAPIYARVSTVDATRERLISLGTMAAGLAHELNNPATAVQRAATELGSMLEDIEGFAPALVGGAIDPGAAARLSRLHTQALAHSAAGAAPGALAAADAEESLLWALETHGIADGWLLAEPLAAAGLDEGWIAAVAEAAGPLTERALRWTVAGLAARRLVAELQDATAQMVALVDATKAYAQLDRDRLVKVDVHEGLDATLALLRRRLDGITVTRDYDHSIPMVAAHGAALNLVWTRLLENAADAAGDGGHVVVATRRQAGYALVTITDDGAGIPAAIQDRVFDPFFTTKEVGRGRGLGLTTAHRIVVGGHGGTIAVDSQPGRTELSVRLPLVSYPRAVGG